MILKYPRPVDTRLLNNAVMYHARQHGLDFKLVSAVIWQESRGNPWATRYEPNFYKKYIQGKRVKDLPGYVPLTNGRSEITELKERATSFGLMQPIGQTAREYGFKSNELTVLLDPMVNIEVGTKILADKIRKKDGDIHKGLLAYNGGGNIEYPNEVMTWLESGAYSPIYVPAFS
jgi:soluble lytic murein transglycosylase-like protein